MKKYRLPLSVAIFTGSLCFSYAGQITLTVGPIEVSQNNYTNKTVDQVIVKTNEVAQILSFYTSGTAGIVITKDTIPYIVSTNFLATQPSGLVYLANA